MAIEISDILYGTDTKDMVTKKWMPSSGLYPSNTTFGLIYIAENAGTVLGEVYSVGDAIQYINGNWQRFGGGSTLDSLVDVVSNAPTTDQVLSFDGLDWVPVDASIISGLVEPVTFTQIATFNGLTSFNDTATFSDIANFDGLSNFTDIASHIGNDITVQIGQQLEYTLSGGWDDGDIIPYEVIDLGNNTYISDVLITALGQGARNVVRRGNLYTGGAYSTQGISDSTGRIATGIRSVDEPSIITPFAEIRSINLLVDGNAYLTISQTEGITTGTESVTATLSSYGYGGISLVAGAQASAELIVNKHPISDYGIATKYYVDQEIATTVVALTTKTILIEYYEFTDADIGVFVIANIPYTARILSCHVTISTGFSVGAELIIGNSAYTNGIAEITDTDLELTGVNVIYSDFEAGNGLPVLPTAQIKGLLTIPGGPGGAGRITFQYYIP